MTMQDQGSVAPEATAGDAPIVDTKPEGSAPEEHAEQQAKPKEDRPAVPRSVINRIGALTRKHEEAIREGATWRERAETLERQFRGQQPGQPQSREPQFDPNQIMSQARATAAFDLKCDAVAEKGRSVPGFSEALSSLGMIGLDRSGLEVLIDADEPTKLIAHLGSHLDEAAEIFAKPPAAMARALAKLEASLGAAPAVSSAPNPLNPVRAAASKSEPQPGTKEWAVKRNEERIKKYGRP